jgi:hypothetical protein
MRLKGKQTIGENRNIAFILPHLFGGAFKAIQVEKT